MASPSWQPDSSTRDSANRPGWTDWLGLNASTLALLGTIVLVTAATELWSPLVPQYLKELRLRFTAGDAAVLLTIAAYGCYRDLLEAINYFAGGGLAGYLNTRRSLLLFNFLPIVGLLILACWQTRLAVFLAVPFVFVWDSIAGPATITVVGDAVPPARRTLAFSLQAIFRRVARVVAYGLSGGLVWWLGRVQGVQAAAGLAIAFVVGAMLVQWRFMRTVSRDQSVAIHRPLALLRRFPPDLKRLLAADIFARWAEGIPREFIILFCMPLLAAQPDRAAALYASVLLTVQAVTNVVLYMVVGPLASRTGLAKKPFIGLTFVFFALFPPALALLGPAFGLAGLVAAFVVGGCRELGEPARKAMIAELVPADVKTQAIGLYWSVRSVAVMAAPLVGGICWILGERWRPGSGPTAMFVLAGIVGLVGAGAFFVRFGRDGLSGGRA